MADGPRLLSHATAAFVDRASIDWGALLSRAGASRDRAVFENLHRLAALRHAARPAGSLPRVRHPAFPIARLLFIVATLQSIGSLALVGAALAAGESVGHRATQVALAVAFLAPALIIGVPRAGDPRGIFLLATFATAGSAFARSALNGLPDAWSAPLGSLGGDLDLEVLTPACLWQFAQHFPRLRRFTRFDAAARVATLAAWGAGVVLLSVNLAAVHGRIDGSPLAFLLRDEPGHLFWHTFAIAVGSALATIAVRSRRAPPSERSRVARFAFAIAVGNAPFLLSGILWAVAPDAAAALPPFARVLVESLIVAALAATPLLCTAAVIRDRPFEVDVLRRVWATAPVRCLLAATAIAPAANVVAALWTVRHAPIVELFSGPRVWPLAACAAASVLLLALRPRLRAAIQRGLFGQPADHRARLTLSLDGVRLARGNREIAAVLAHELRHGLHVEHVRVLVAARDGAFVDASDTTRLSGESALVTMLDAATAPLDLSSLGPIAALLPPADRAWAAASGADVATALKRPDGRLAAVVICGAKRTGAAFDRRDRWLLTTLCTGAAAAWEDVCGGAVGVGRRSHDAGEVAVECPRCGVVADAVPLPCVCDANPILASLPYRLAGTFEVRRRLGAGGMGIVYLARDMTLDRDVALKTMPSRDARHVAPLRREAQAMAALNHECLATIYGLERWRSTPVLVVEYLAGGTLAARLAAGPLPAGPAFEMGIRAARALASMHASGMLHRDLKPSNIGFTANGTAKLLDFGLVTFPPPRCDSDTACTRADVRDAARGGTLAYLPPEAGSAQASAAFDLWALAVVLLESMTRTNPFRRARRGRATHRAVAELTSRVEMAAPGLGAFLVRALSPAASRRVQTAAEVVSALEDLAAASTPQDGSAPPRRHT